MSLFDQLVNQALSHNSELTQLRTKDEFLTLAHERADLLTADAQVKKDFRHEMQRFLPVKIVESTINNEQFWNYLCNEIPSLIKQVERYMSNRAQTNAFLM